MRFLVAVVLAFFLTPALAQEPEYRLQPGDVVEIWVAQQPDLNRQIIVAPDGRISLPMAGHLRAESLTLEELEAALKARLQVNFKTPLDLTAILVKSQAPQAQAVPTVYVVGNVSHPGAYPIRPGMTVLHAVSLAGGYARSDQAGNGSVSPQSALETARKHYYELVVREARLRAEIDDKDSITLPPGFAEGADANLLSDIVRNESMTLDIRRSNRLAEREGREQRKNCYHCRTLSIAQPARSQSAGTGSRQEGVGDHTLPDGEGACCR